ncbi:histidinol-phosphate aminotransferase [Penicillium freii]|nr:histidinol-phosphate aminotransferase [Penicillium freii]
MSLRQLAWIYKWHVTPAKQGTRGSYNAIRPNIYALPKYIASTSDGFQARSKILLDANENSLGTCLAPPAKFSNGWDPSCTNELLGYIFAGTTSLNRYPSASQAQLKSHIAESRKEHGITDDKIWLGTGAADVIDLLMRVTCRPGKDATLVTSRTIGLYKIRAAFQEADEISCPLYSYSSFNLRVSEACVISVLGPRNLLYFLITILDYHVESIFQL